MGSRIRCGIVGRAACLATATVLLAAATACSDGGAGDFIWGRTPSWVPPAGGVIVYSQNLSTPSERFTNTIGAFDTGTIWRVNANGALPTRITPPGRGPDFYPAVSPDGTQIAYVAGEDGQFDVWVMNLDGTGRRQLTFDRATDTTPSWMPDGRSILFVSARSGTADIWRIGVDGTGLVQLTSLPSDEASPRASTDGTRIAFASSQDRGNFDIWVMDSTGGNPVQLTRKDEPDSNISDGTPTWSPDGLQLAFERWDGNWNIWRIDADGTDLVQLTDTRDHNGDPVFSPDGGAIAFTSSRDGWWQIWLMDPSGGNLRQVTGD